MLNDTQKKLLLPFNAADFEAEQKDDKKINLKSKGAKINLGF